MSLGAAGADLEAKGNYTILPKEKIMIDTGTAVAIPEGYFGMCCPRSSLCNKGGLRLVNSLGIIDHDYRGTIRFVYENVSDKAVVIEEGERIGQMVVLPFVKAEFIKVDTLEDTERGCGGFGSTGIK
jgi:dUTP pyrophosphatase